MGKPAPLTLYRAVELLNIDADRRRTKVNIKCPRCGSGYEKKLNIDFEKDVFRCAKCGASGKSIGLWAMYRGFDPQDLKAAAKDYYEYAGDRKLSSAIQRMYTPQPQKPIAPIETRDRTYRALLSQLHLKDNHRMDLLRRGFTEGEINTSDYRSYPSIGRAEIVKTLLQKGCVLEGVPGFYKEGDTWKLRRLTDGYLIPQLNSNGQIQGFQVRMSHGDIRYITLSTDGFKDGTAGKAYPHFVQGIKKEGKLIITEGPLKADLISKFTGYSVLALQGVNATAAFPGALRSLAAQGYSMALLAFDMDLFTNEYVREALSKLKKLLEKEKMPYQTLIWDPQYKGLDDFLLAKNQEKS